MSECSKASRSLLLQAMGVTQLGGVAALSSLRSLYPADSELETTVAMADTPPSPRPGAAVVTPSPLSPPSSWRHVSIRDHILHLTFIAEVAAAGLWRDGAGSEAAQELLSGFPVMALAPAGDWEEVGRALEAQQGGEEEGGSGSVCWPLRPAHRLRFALDGEWAPLQPDVLSAGLPVVHPSLVRTLQSPCLPYLPALFFLRL